MASIELPTAAEGDRLLVLARRALLAHFAIEFPETPDDPPAIARSIGGLFATLERGGELRGCIGFLSPSEDLFDLTRRAVVAAAMDDPRFSRVVAEEVPLLRIGITVLAPPEPMRSCSDVVIGRHGLLVQRGSCRGLLLPQVAERRAWDAARFLSETCRKAELPGESWRDPETVVSVFEAVHFEESPAPITAPSPSPPRTRW